MKKLLFLLQINPKNADFFGYKKKQKKLVIEAFFLLFEQFGFFWC